MADNVEEFGPTRIRPLSQPNLKDLRGIPIGSEVVVVNYSGEIPPDIGCIPWTQEMVQNAEEQLEDDDSDYFGATFMAFLPPESHSANAIDEDVIVEQALGSLETVKDLAGMNLLIRTVIQEARKGLVENPF